MNDTTLSFIGRMVCGLCNMIVGHSLCKAAIVLFGSAVMLAYSLIVNPHSITGDKGELWWLVTFLFLAASYVSIILYHFLKILHSPSPDVSIVSDRENINET